MPTSIQVKLRFFVTALLTTGNKSGHLSRFVSFCTRDQCGALDGQCLPVVRVLVYRGGTECGNAKKPPGIMSGRSHPQSYSFVRPVPI